MTQCDDSMERRNIHLPDLNVKLTGYVGVIEIRRPPHNFFDFALIKAIADALDWLAEQTDCRCVVLAAAGKAFCAGARFGNDHADPDASAEFTEDGFRHTTGKLYTCALRIFANPLPLVAAVQGPAIGGGLGLALSADFRVADYNARFAANFVKLGLHQGFGISVTLPRIVGTVAASAMLLTGQRLNAEAAQRIGLVDRLVDGDVREAAITLAEEIAENAPLAVRSVRKTLREGLVAEIAAATEHELSEQQWLRATADAREGIRAVAAREPGRFIGE